MDTLLTDIRHALRSLRPHAWLDDRMKECGPDGIKIDFGFHSVYDDVASPGAKLWPLTCTPAPDSHSTSWLSISWPRHADGAD
jgi:hypothetical protein